MYYILAECWSDTILGLEKVSIGIIIVVFDVVVVYFVWIMLQVHGRFERYEEKEIEEQTLTGSDFTI